MTRRTARLAAPLAAAWCAAALAGCGAAKTPGDGTSVIDCEPSAHARDDAVGLLGAGEYRIGGWNHMLGIGAFETQGHEPRAYTVTPEKYLPAEACGGEPVLSVVLASKTYDWDRRHGNGIEAQFPSENLTFADVTDVVLEFRYDPDASALPGPAALADAYDDLLDAEAARAIDSGDLAFEVTLFGPSAAGPSVNAGVLIVVDEELAREGWVRVQVPREELTFYTEESYERTVVDPAELDTATVQGLRLVPETTSATVARHAIGDQFDPQGAPEVFKEMALEIALIEIGRDA